jgi:hypothetical protein
MFAFKKFAAPLFVFALAGCDGGAKGLPVDYGTEIPVTEIQKAIVQGVKGIDPAATQCGAAVQYTTTQYLAGGQVVNLLEITTLVVVERDEIPATSNTPAAVRLKFRESKLDVSKPREQASDPVQREFVEYFAKGPISSSFVAEAKGAPIALSAPAEAPRLHAMSAAGVRVSFHRLTTSSASGQPPQPVTEKANCRDVPGCQMTYNKISFDQVAWKPEGPEKIHFDFAVSPNVPQISGFNMSPLFPYYQGLVKSCVTLLVKVGDGYDKTLLMECQQVQDFLYRQSSPQCGTGSTTADPF